jgi:GGDEF domain-containing protein
VAREAVAAGSRRPDQTVLEFRPVLEFRLRHMTEFRDQYGTLAAADLLRYTALMMNRVLNSHGTPDDFLGQLEDERFVVVTSAERAEGLLREIVARFNADAVQHYALAERMGDRVRVRDSAGREQVLPLVGLEATAAA